MKASDKQGNVHVDKPRKTKPSVTVEVLQNHRTANTTRSAGIRFLLPKYPPPESIPSVVA